jgi:hypothetical protein
MNKLLPLVILLLSLLHSGSEAQSLTGVTGLLNIPSADMQKDGTFYTGSNYLNRNYVRDYGYGKYNCVIWYFDLTFLPFLEINFRSTRRIGDPDPSHTVDRMFSGKLRVLKEGKYWPSVVLGGNDVVTTGKISNQFFGAAYLVMTKNFKIKNNTLGGTLGYSYPLFRHNQFDGFFGGISFSPSFLRQLTIMAEYDTRTFNIGGSVLFFKHLYIFALLQGFEGFSGGIAFKVSAFSGFKTQKQNKDKSGEK